MSSFTYTVNWHSSIDCYKRASTDTSTIYSGPDQLMAYGHAVGKWLELWCDRAEGYYEPDELDVDNTLHDMLKRVKAEPGNFDALAAVHGYFEDMAYSIWEPEYIGHATEEISINVVENKETFDVIPGVTEALRTINTALAAQGLIEEV